MNVHTRPETSSICIRDKKHQGINDKALRILLEQAMMEEKLSQSGIDDKPAFLPIPADAWQPKTRWARFKDRWLGPLVEYEPGQAQQGPVAINWRHVAFIVAMIVLTWVGLVMEG